MRTPVIDDDDDLQQIENLLRSEAAGLLQHFDGASMPRLTTVSATPVLERRTAALSTAIAGMMLCAFGGWLAVHEHAPDISYSIANGSELADHDAAVDAQDEDLESIVERFRDGYGRLPVLLRLVDEQGNDVGTGIYYPEQEVPVDFTDLSPSEQQAAVRLLRLESSAVPGITI